MALDDTQKLFTGDTVLAPLVLTDRLGVFVGAIERLLHALPVLVRLLVVLAVAHTELVEVFDTVEDAELDLDTVLVFELVTDEVNVWLTDPLTERVPLGDMLADALLTDELDAETELVSLCVTLPDPDTDSLPVSLKLYVLRLVGEYADEGDLAEEKLPVTLTVFVTPVGNVVSLTVPVAAILPDTLTLLDLVLTGDTELVIEPVEVLEPLLLAVIVEVLYIVRVPTTLDVVHGLVLLVLDGPGARDIVPEPVVVFDAEADPVKLAELLDDLL